MFNVDDVRAEIDARGILRGNKFSFACPLAPAFPQNQVAGLAGLVSANQRLELYCEAATIPGVALAINEVRRYGYGPLEKKPYVPVFSDLSLAFRCDAKGQLWDYMHTWARLAVCYESGPQGMTTVTGSAFSQAPYEVSYKDGYAVDATLTSYDDSGKPAIQITLKECYPVFIGDLPHDWSSRDQYVRIPVTMTFLDWFQVVPGASPHSSSQTLPTGAASLNQRFGF